MTGDFTSVPLRATDRWTAARMQQGRVLLDNDWNLNLDGPARDERQLALDAIGPAGVPEGSNAFAISYVGTTLTIGAGTMWIGGLLARNPADLAYADQPEIAPAAHQRPGPALPRRVRRRGPSRRRRRPARPGHGRRRHHDADPDRLAGKGDRHQDEGVQRSRPARRRAAPA